ncbi:conserved Plasmodium protein, unknown function [Plasmodium relictum]|uniref:Uncharacterized protein n=1 Tax=Plasmodium relictum TaxID=85471 RepID=A0A1J1HC73_PLARL|nr:conserved Plasmodium protein, unknown function [Plasmodium relictum]CRH02903.1 conserved Plasmodium protein, unknown function [Plasmodium relictum]
MKALKSKSEYVLNIKETYEENLEDYIDNNCHINNYNLYDYIEKTKKSNSYNNKNPNKNDQTSKILNYLLEDFFSSSENTFDFLSLQEENTKNNSNLCEVEGKNNVDNDAKENHSKNILCEKILNHLKNREQNLSQNKKFQIILNFLKENMNYCKNKKDILEVNNITNNAKNSSFISNKNESKEKNKNFVNVKNEEIKNYNSKTNKEPCYYTINNNNENDNYSNYNDYKNLNLDDLKIDEIIFGTKNYSKKQEFKEKKFNNHIIKSSEISYIVNKEFSNEDAPSIDFSRNNNINVCKNFSFDNKEKMLEDQSLDKMNNINKLFNSIFFFNNNKGYDNIKKCPDIYHNSRNNLFNSNNNCMNYNILDNEKKNINNSNKAFNKNDNDSKNDINSINNNSYKNNYNNITSSNNFNSNSNNNINNKEDNNINYNENHINRNYNQNHINNNNNHINSNNDDNNNKSSNEVIEKEVNKVNINSNILSNMYETNFLKYSVNEVNEYKFFDARINEKNISPQSFELSSRYCNSNLNAKSTKKNYLENTDTENSINLHEVDLNFMNDVPYNFREIYEKSNNEINNYIEKNNYFENIYENKENIIFSNAYNKKISDHHEVEQKDIFLKRNQNNNSNNKCFIYDESNLDNNTLNNVKTENNNELNNICSPISNFNNENSLLNSFNNIDSIFHNNSLNVNLFLNNFNMNNLKNKNETESFSKEKYVGYFDEEIKNHLKQEKNNLERQINRNGDEIYSKKHNSNLPNEKNNFLKFSKITSIYNNDESFYTPMPYELNKNGITSKINNEEESNLSYDFDCNQEKIIKEENNITKDIKNNCSHNKTMNKVEIKKTSNRLLLNNYEAYFENKKGKNLSRNQSLHSEKNTESWANYKKYIYSKSSNKNMNNFYKKKNEEKKYLTKSHSNTNVNSLTNKSKYFLNKKTNNTNCFKDDMFVFHKNLESNNDYKKFKSNAQLKNEENNNNKNIKLSLNYMNDSNRPFLKNSHNMNIIYNNSKIQSDRNNDITNTIILSKNSILTDINQIKNSPNESISSKMNNAISNMTHVNNMHNFHPMIYDNNKDIINNDVSNNNNNNNNNYNNNIYNDNDNNCNNINKINSDYDDDNIYNNNSDCDKYDNYNNSNYKNKDNKNNNHYDDYDNDDYINSNNINNIDIIYDNDNTNNNNNNNNDSNNSSSNNSNNNDNNINISNNDYINNDNNINICNNDYINNSNNNNDNTNDKNKENNNNNDSGNSTNNNINNNDSTNNNYNYNDNNKNKDNSNNSYDNNYNESNNNANTNGMNNNVTKVSSKDSKLDGFNTHNKKGNSKKMKFSNNLVLNNNSKNMKNYFFKDFQKSNNNNISKNEISFQNSRNIYNSGNNRKERKKKKMTNSNSCNDLQNYYNEKKNNMKNTALTKSISANNLNLYSILYDAILSLYDERIKPTEKEVVRKLKELNINSKFIKNIYFYISSYPEFIIEKEENSDTWVVYLKNEPADFKGFFDPCDKDAPCDENVWNSFLIYLIEIMKNQYCKAENDNQGNNKQKDEVNENFKENNENGLQSSISENTLLNNKLENDNFSKTNEENSIPILSFRKKNKKDNVDQIYRFKGGRYNMAVELKNRNLSFLKNLKLGEICHLIQKSISLNILRYEDKYLQPLCACNIVVFSSMFSLGLNVEQKYGVTTSSQLGFPHLGDIEIHPIRTIEQVKKCLNEILKNFPLGAAIGHLKKTIIEKYGLYICPMIFRYTRLCPLLASDLFSNTCRVFSDTNHRIFVQLVHFEMPENVTLYTPKKAKKEESSTENAITYYENLFKKNISYIFNEVYYSKKYEELF